MQTSENLRPEAATAARNHDDYPAWPGYLRTGINTLAGLIKVQVKWRPRVGNDGNIYLVL
jgi:hypothetical protein